MNEFDVWSLKKKMRGLPWEAIADQTYVPPFGKSKKQIDVYWKNKKAKNNLHYLVWEWILGSSYFAWIGWSRKPYHEIRLW